GASRRWEIAVMSSATPANVQRKQNFSAGKFATRLVAVILILSGAITFVYMGLSVYIAAQLVYEAPKPIAVTPAQFQLQYREVTFPARGVGVQVKGWSTPGTLSGGRLTASRTIIMVHGTRQNRANPQDGMVDLSAIFVRAGFAVLGFDMRGMGESQPAPL